jgi:hypothetical protein
MRDNIGNIMGSPEQPDIRHVPLDVGELLLHRGESESLGNSLTGVTEESLLRPTLRQIPAPQYVKEAHSYLMENGWLDRFKGKWVAYDLSGRIRVDKKDIVSGDLPEELEARLREADNRGYFFYAMKVGNGSYQ